MNAATLKGYREICGMTQQGLAELCGVSLVTVKKWERGERAVPQDVSDAVLARYRAHCEMVDDLVARCEGLPAGSVAAVEYFRSQEQADIASECESGAIGSEAVHYQELNAAARTAAEILLDSGQPVVFAYPDEERMQRAPEL